MLMKKYGYIDEYLLFSLLAPNIENRVTFVTDKTILKLPTFDMDMILMNDTADTFSKILHTFLDKNAISGVQPKSIAILKDKDSLENREYIIKTWGDEYPYLAENEFFCLQALKKAGIPIPEVKLSQNNRFLVVKKFIYKEDGSLLGFEEVLSLMEKNSINKYQGSYEQVAKTIYPYLSNKKESMRNFFKTIIMNYLLKNGDAHLKNFGLLFSDDFKEVWFAPAYDVVTTTAYIYKDKPALMMDGKKVWFSKESLIKFGIKSCFLSKSEAKQCYEECKNSLLDSIRELEIYIDENRHFNQVGKRMLSSWKLSLEEINMKEISDDTIRTWREY
jgi:serine/threonine-protein kinase HipA